MSSSSGFKTKLCQDGEPGSVRTVRRDPQVLDETHPFKSAPTDYSLVFPCERPALDLPGSHGELPRAAASRRRSPFTLSAVGDGGDGRPGKGGIPSILFSVFFKLRETQAVDRWEKERIRKKHG
ncbi:hypothetical protein DPEC_G00076530 [Dallia pectoralis]|uniref:Uncharacterized protein n=1 Tax=Dallia pectoralis TaxID=75939 RepID=A0ACC2H3Y5_DALPE|nr:hypothetical protein DPEC_G00076530 [Dallia pectoralis]